MRIAGFWAIGLIAVALSGAAVAATSSTLTQIGDGSVRLIQDGTSNTIQLGETSSAVICFRNASRPASITDGTSNTLLLSETLGLGFTAGHAYQYMPVFQFGDGSVRTVFAGEGPSYSYCVTEADLLDPVTITDGTSNTIRIGEGGDLSFCFNNVRLTQITDGTSNTIQFGENDPQACFQNVGIDPNVTTVPGPGLLALFAMGLLGLGGAAHGLRWRSAQG